MKPTLKALLVQWRVRQGLTQEGCATRLGVSARTLHRWESPRPQVRRGQRVVTPVPPWLKRFVEQNVHLPPLKE